MILQIVSISAITGGVIAATGYAFYKQGQKISRQQNISLQVQAAALQKKLDHETERANRLSARYRRLLGQNPLVRDAKTGQIKRFHEVEEFLNEG